MATKAQKSTALLTGTSPDNWSHQDAVQFLEAAQTVGDLSAMHTHVNEALAEDVSKIEEAPEETFKVVTVEPDPMAELEGRVAGLLFSVTGPAQYKQFKAGHKEDFVKAALSYLELVEGHKAEWRKLNARYLELNPEPEEDEFDRYAAEAEAMAQQEFEAGHWVAVAKEQQLAAPYDGPQVRRAKAIAKFVAPVDSDTIKAGNWMPEEASIAEQVYERERTLIIGNDEEYATGWRQIDDYEGHAEVLEHKTSCKAIETDNRAIVWPKEEPVEQYCEEQIVGLKTAGNVYAEYKDDELKAICRTFGIKGFSKGTKAYRAHLIAKTFGLKLNLMVPDVTVEPVDEKVEEAVVSPEIEEAKANWAQALKAYNKAEDDGEDTKELAIISHGWFHRYGALKAKVEGDMEKAQEHIDAHRALRAEYKALSTKTDRDVEAAVVDHHLEGEAEKVAERILQDAARAHVPAQMYRNDEGELVVRVHKGQIRLTNIRMDLSFVHNAYMRVEKWIDKGWICHVEAI